MISPKTVKSGTWLTNRRIHDLEDNSPHQQRSKKFRKSTTRQQISWNQAYYDFFSICELTRNLLNLRPCIISLASNGTKLIQDLKSPRWHVVFLNIGQLTMFFKLTTWHRISRIDKLAGHISHPPSDIANSLKPQTGGKFLELTTLQYLQLTIWPEISRMQDWFDVS